MNWTWIYIGILYAAAIWLARRSGVDIPRRVALFFYALVLVFFFQPLTGNFLHSQDDVLNTLPPWHLVVQNKEAINGEMNDIPLQHTVWGHQAREAWKSFRAPLWNQYSGSGYPLMANGQSSALSPIRLINLPVPAKHFMAAEAATKILIALTFTFLFCRGRGYAELASVIAAAIFAFSGFLHSWLHFPHITTACFLPAVLYLIDRMALQHAPRAGAGSPPPPPSLEVPASQGQRGRRSGLIVAAALTWTAILFGGHPETASHIFFLALLYVVWIVFVEKRANWRLFLTLGGAMTVAALLSAPFLLPFLEALPKSQRYQALNVMPLEAKALPYKDLDCMIVLFQGHFFGRVPFEKPWGPAVAEPMGGFAGVLGIAACFALLVHVIRRRAWRSTEFFFVLATVIVFGVINGWPFIGDAIHAVLPVVAHARFRLLFVLLLAVQAAAAIDLTLRTRSRELVIGAAIVAAMLLALFTLHSFPDDARRMTSILTSMRSVTVLVLAVLVATLTRWRKVALLGLLVAVIGELWPVTRAWNPVLPGDAFYPRTPYIEALLALKDKHAANDPFRIAGIGPMVYPNTNAMFGLEDIRAHDPMSNDRYMGFLRLTADYKTGPENYHPWYENNQTSVLNYLNVRYLMQDPWFQAPDPDQWKVVYEAGDGKIFENQRALPRFFAVRNVVLEFRDQQFIERLGHHTEWSHTALLDELDVEVPQMRTDFFAPRPANAPVAIARIVSAGPSSYRISVDAPRWSLIVSSVPWWPGWTITRNGESANPIRVNGAFLGFAVPPGHSDVRVTYSPWTWWLGLGLAATGVAILIVIARRRS